MYMHCDVWEQLRFAANFCKFDYICLWLAEYSQAPPLSPVKQAPAKTPTETVRNKNECILPPLPPGGTQCVVRTIANFTHLGRHTETQNEDTDTHSQARRINMTS